MNSNMVFGLSIGSVRIIEDRNLVDYVEDWSKVRSPARARRRRKLGYPQNITTVAVAKQSVYSLDGGRTMVMHPDIARRMEQQIAEQMRDLESCMIMGRP